MIDEVFSKGISPVHRIDPRVKLLSAFIYSVSISVCNNINTLLFSLFISFMLILLAKLNPKKVAARLLLVNSFILLLWLILPFSTNGTELVSVGFFRPSLRGIQLAFLITVKSNAIVMAMIALVGTSKLVDLTHALHHLYVPDKLVQLFSFTISYLELISLEYKRLVQAMKIRGFVPKTNLHTYRSYAYLFAMVLVRGVERSERVYSAMLCRGYDGTLYTLNHFYLQKSDVSWLLLFAAISVFIFVA